MIITSIRLEDYGVDVTAETDDNEETFTVQLCDNKYRSGLGCWITTSKSGGDINEDDYPDFDMSAIIEAAEQHALAEFKANYTETTIDFHCAINDCHVVMRTDKAGDVELIIEDCGHIGSYERRYRETGVTFDSEEDALEYADTFRTDNEHQDCDGLYAFMQEIQGE